MSKQINKKANKPINPLTFDVFDLFASLRQCLSLTKLNYTHIFCSILNAKDDVPGECYYLDN